MELPFASIKRLMKNAEPNYSMSKEAVILVKAMLEDYAFNVSLQAAENAKHAGRVTVRAEDIALALTTTPSPI